MREYKNIDRVFQENFKDMEISPSKHVWNNIESHLQGNQKKKKVLPLWQRISGIAVAFLLLFSLGFNYFKTGKKLQFNTSDFSMPDFNSALTSLDTNSTLIPIFKNNASKAEKSVVVATDDKQAGNKTLSDEILITEDDYLNTVAYEEASAKETDTEKADPEDKIAPATFKKFSIEDYSRKVAEVNKNEQKERKWSVGPNVSPVYMSSLQKGSPISKDLKNNPVVGEEALSYGVKLDYRISDKFRIQTGINRLELAYNTKNVNAVISSSKSINHNIDTKYNGIHLSPGLQEDFPVSASEDLNKSGINGDLNQSFDYLEIPLEMKYNLYDSKIGLNIVGGFSTFVLTNNQVSMIQSDQITNLGQANNLNTFNFSGNLGFDLDYKISKDWYLSVSPMLKYQFNTFSNDAGNFKPYFFGVYSGVNYRF